MNPALNVQGAMANFTIKPPKQKYFFRVLVFSTKKKMHQWYKVNEVDFGYRNEAGNFAGMVLPYEWIKVDKDGNEERFAEIGTVLLWKNRLGSGVIAHEMLHCALWYERLINGNKQATFGEHIGDEEERLAYLLTDFTRILIKQLYALKIL